TLAVNQWMAAQQASQGTLLLMVSARTSSHLQLGQVSVHSASGWHDVSSGFSGTVAAAPGTTSVARVSLPAATYGSLRVDGRVLDLRATVSAGQVEPVLLAVAGGRPVAEGAYSGNDQVNVGINELAGRVQSLPSFSLVDQAGRPFTNDTIRGKTVVLAAFHTNCHETCPLYTGLFLQLQKKIPSSVQLVEATVDPATDTPQVLQQYAQQTGAGWTFATGTAQQMTDFWQPFSVQLSSGDVHTSELAVIDPHGYIRSVYQGVPDVGGALPASLSQGLNAAGLQDVRGNGDGWGVSQLLDTLAAVDRPTPAQAQGGGTAAGFQATDLSGRRVSLQQFRGQPLVLNFWASWCTPCRQEMPLLQQAARDHPGLHVLLVDERDSGATAQSFVSSLGVTLPVALDPDGKIGTSYQVLGLPTSVFVRPDATVASRYAGVLDPSTLANHLGDLGLS
ncbi:MAG: redoxin domain-containing protein, partial [Candidatus Dormibacteraeota bacterium]|nr:redoxin domain-containing protein [Candidatus Dormibacteraeota bacterium]